MPLSNPELVRSRPHLYVPDGALDSWRAAKANASSAPCWISFLEDSYGVQQSSAYLTKPFDRLLRASLLQTYPRYADFWPITESSDFMVARSTTYPDATPPWAVNATNRTWTVAGVQWTAQYTGAAVDVLSFTTPEADSTDLDAVSYGYAAGTYTAKVDGGGAQTLTSTGGGTAGYFQKFPILTGGAAGSHTAVFGSPSVANAMMLVGVASYASRTRGIGFARFAAPGFSMASLPINYPTDRFLPWQGNDASGATHFGFPFQPALTVLHLGINDCQNVTGVQQYHMLLRRWVQALRRGNRNASILLLGQAFPDGVNSDTTSAGTNPQNWPLYLQVQRQVAEEFTCVWANFHAKWGEYGGALGFQTNGNFHPTDAGHADIAATLLPLLV